MKTLYRISTVLLILGLLALPMLTSGCQATPAPPLKVVTTTSLLGAIVEEVGGEHVSVTVVVPPASCPGHFDAKPGDIQALAEAALFLKHGWEGFADGLIEAAENPDLEVVTVQVEGNWMAPPVQAQAVNEVVAVLSQVDSAHQSDYQDNGEAYRALIEETEQRLEERLSAATVSQVPVLCAQYQAGFVNWAGFNVVATYGRLEELTPQQIEELVDQAREAGVVLVIDNLQSGPETGVGMAQEIGAAHVTLSNFPGGFEGTETWETAVEKNVDLLLEALEG
ncbi:MAG TPA: zinc ABC transporter substrate-binding protein [Anaerolineae bacterium]|nr:zinc ABC transporter substrate-binding protein [Anaerolineae bacterium]